MKEYHVSVSGQQPVLVDENVLAKEAAEGKYLVNTLIWCEGMTDWEPIGKHFRMPLSPPPLSAVGNAFAGVARTGAVKKTAAGQQKSGSQSCVKSSIPWYVGKACLFFLISLLFLFYTLCRETNSYIHARALLGFLVFLCWGIKVLKKHR